MTGLSQRFEALGRDAQAPVPAIEPGTRDDYLALEPHHYRPGHPMTMMRILTIRDRRPTPADRYLSQRATPRPIAVLIESLPSLSCRMREAALGGRYGHLSPKPRSALLNEELRCISRVIVDPRWRGLGLAVRLVRHALSTASTRYTEALAVMGRISPFFENAGMTPYPRPPLPTDERALAALRSADIDPRMLVLPSAMAGSIDAMDQPRHRWLLGELTRWYRTAGGRGAQRTPELPDILAAAQQRLLARPIYYLHENHDA